MSSTGIRPPLFDPEPEPEGFDAAHGGPKQQFPQRRPSGGRGYPRTRSGSSPTATSPRWVRPFIFGGLVLIAVISLVSILTDDGAPSSTEQPTTAPVVATPDQPDQPDQADQAEQADQAAVDPTGDDVQTAPATEVAEAGAGEETVADTALPQASEEPDGEDLVEGGVAADPLAIQPLSAELQVATAFAVQFTHDYLNYDQAQPDVRERDLRAYLAPGLDPQLGWDGQGTQLAVLTVPIETVAQDDRVVVTVAAQVTGQDAPRWVQLAVPLAQDESGRWAVIAPPAYVPRPGPGNPATDPEGAVDQELSTALTPAMEQLFAAYASEGSVAVGGVTAPGAMIRGLQGQVMFVNIDSVRITADEDDTVTGSVVVTWTDTITGGSIRQSYSVDLVGSEDTWLVEAVSVS